MEGRERKSGGVILKLGIIGGVLQGMEAVYLAKKAGFETLVVDRWADAPALALADQGMVIDVVQEKAKARSVLSDCDAVLPANENIATLAALDHMFKAMQVPLLFDLAAYRISSSKLLSNRMMSDLGVPAPLPWPVCGFPAVVKPSGQSGSSGVVKAGTVEDMERGIRMVKDMGDEPVIQEFVEGPNISVEVIGDGERAVPLVLTEVILDASYDCKMVRCPGPDLDPDVAELFANSSRAIAEEISLRGIMDLEAIVHRGVPKALEIDARIPSQTPAAVLNATGVNIVKVLVEALTRGNFSAATPTMQGAAIYEHIVVEGNVMTSCGEGVFSQVRRPRLEHGLFGADDVITDYSPDKDRWYATIICSGSSPEDAWAKRLGCLRAIMERNNIEQYVDPSPEMTA